MLPRVIIEACGGGVQLKGDPTVNEGNMSVIIAW
jgi:hypothetical protein